MKSRKSSFHIYKVVKNWIRIFFRFYSFIDVIGLKKMLWTFTTMCYYWLWFAPSNRKIISIKFKLNPCIDSREEHWWRNQTKCSQRVLLNDFVNKNQINTRTNSKWNEKIEKSKKDPTLQDSFRFSYTTFQWFWRPVEAKRKNKFWARNSSSSCAIELGLKMKKASRETEETFWHSMCVCAGVSLELFLKCKDSYLRHNRAQHS